ncbi:MAG TPA: hypothetical protein VFS43_26115 [Polyangiaceae bacterium]|nr:hypothetical protein [Polyangiaceae bacterium]
MNDAKRGWSNHLAQIELAGAKTNKINARRRETFLKRGAFQGK